MLPINFQQQEKGDEAAEEIKLRGEKGIPGMGIPLRCKN
jgi:hypothetical protein